MRQRRRATIEDLRTAIACLPHQTRVAMLDGIARNPIVVGAYSDDSGICPMLAAHRSGGRTNFIGFARAWDRFAFRETSGSRRRRRPRRASERELLVLRTHLEASLLEDDVPTTELAAARAEHEALLATRSEGAHLESGAGSAGPSERVRPGDADRSRELRRRPGWRWMRVVRNLEDYERLLAALQEERAEQVVGVAPGGD